MATWESRSDRANAFPQIGQSAVSGLGTAFLGAKKSALEGFSFLIGAILREIREGNCVVGWMGRAMRNCGR